MAVLDPPAEATPAGAAQLILARSLVARITHDLGSPLGTLVGMLEMLESGTTSDNGEMLEIAKQAASDLRARLALQRAAWGGGGEPADHAGLLALLAGSAAAQRVVFSLVGPLFAQTVPAGLVPLVLNAALLAAEALPRGGTVTASGSGHELVLLPEGRNAAWPAVVVAALSGRGTAALESGPRQVLTPLLLAMAAEQRFDVSLMAGAGAGMPALHLVCQD